jgi:hypothetical protein
MGSININIIITAAISVSSIILLPLNCLAGRPVISEFSEPLKGKILQVQHNSTTFLDCTYRLSSPSGASFPANRYQPSQPIQTIINSPESIIFLIERKGQLELVADGALEAIGKRRELQSIKFK